MKVQEKIVADIKKYGWHSIHILEDENGEKYSYTIGLSESFNHPEIAISGLSNDICSQIFEEIVESIQEGAVYQTNKEYDRILDGYSCVFKKIDINRYDDLFGQSQAYYKEKEYTVLQLFYPDKNIKFPWEQGYPLRVQEIL